MAKRICFFSTPTENICYNEVEIEFKYYSGFAISQKQKCITEMHNNINRIYPDIEVLEVSTKSLQPLGVDLSAFNLKYYDENSNQEFNIENIFQSSKVFQDGGPYRDLLYVHPRQAKKDERLRTSGKLCNFNFGDRVWDLEPKTMFYDWIYIKSLYRDKELSKKILNYTAFTDIEFNHMKSINCQARAAAIFVSLTKRGTLEEYLNNKEKFKTIYGQKSKQISLFD